jgi:carboxymethylenebutenolidase
MDVSFPRPDGELCSGYLAEPGHRRNGKCLLIVHELWGVSAPVRSIADRFAAEGYRSLVPDLFRGRVPVDLPEGVALAAKLDGVRAVEQDLRGAAEWLAGGSARLACIGFCLGGALTLLAARRLKALAAAVSFYGIPDPAAADPADIEIPFLGHFARYDDWCTPQKVDELEQRLRAGAVDHRLYRYEAAHAFMNREGDGYSEAASQLAWRRTLDFLDRTLV